MEAPPHICHPERTPDFLLRCTIQRPRMRLSLRKAARGLPTPLSLTGNPEEAEGPAVLSTGNEGHPNPPSTDEFADNMGSLHPHN